MSETVEIRNAQVSDGRAICQMCADTVRRVNIRDYSSEQVEKWSKRLELIDRMESRLAEQNGLVAMIGEEIAGVVTWTENGYLDLFYIHADHQGVGIGRQLMHHLINSLPTGVALESDVSITARPFFESFGFEPEAEKTVNIDGVPFTNYSMKLKIK